MVADVINFKNEKVGTADLVENIFGVAWKPELVSFAVVAQRANAREPWANAKDRGEVSGGGRKPWRQKGTGRARHGSSRSPIWVGGGATHGPLSIRDYSKSINKKQKRAALFSLLSKRLADQDLKVIDSFKLDGYHTRDLKQILENIFNADPKQSVVLVATPSNQAISLAARNLPGVSTLSPESLNVYDIFIRRHLVIEQAALDIIVKHFSRALIGSNNSELTAAASANS